MSVRLLALLIGGLRSECSSSHQKGQTNVYECSWKHSHMQIAISLFFTASCGVLSGNLHRKSHKTFYTLFFLIYEEILKYQLKHKVKNGENESVASFRNSSRQDLEICKCWNIVEYWCKMLIKVMRFCNLCSKKIFINIHPADCRNKLPKW